MVAGEEVQLFLSVKDRFGNLCPAEVEDFDVRLLLELPSEANGLLAE